MKISLLFYRSIILILNKTEFDKDEDTTKDILRKSLTVTTDHICITVHKTHTHTHTLKHQKPNGNSR